jgi:hypothetical protein
MSNPATTADLSARWRPLTAQEATNGQTFLDDAWRMLKRKTKDMSPSLDTQISTDADLRAEVVRVLATAVLRVMKNPDGKRQESIDDYSWQRDQSISAGLLYISDEELADITPGATISGRAYTIDALADYAARLAE